MEYVLIIYAIIGIATFLYVVTTVKDVSFTLKTYTMCTLLCAIWPITLALWYIDTLQG